MAKGAMDAVAREREIPNLRWTENRVPGIIKGIPVMRPESGRIEGEVVPVRILNQC